MGDLLKKAKAYHKTTTRKTRPINDDDIELAIAWITDEIETQDVRKAYEGFYNKAALGGSMVLYRLALSLREAARRGLLYARATPTAPTPEDVEARSRAQYEREIKPIDLKI